MKKISSKPHNQESAPKPFVQKDKTKFRASSVWRNFSRRLKSERARDALTGKRLVKGSVVHHMNLDPYKYADLSNEENFVTLNPLSHKTVHFLYTAYRKDPQVLERLKDLLDRMVEIN